MAAKRPNRTTIIVTPEVRDDLKHIARKDQNYSDILKELIVLHSASVNVNDNRSQNQKIEVEGHPEMTLQDHTVSPSRRHSAHQSTELPEDYKFNV